MGSKSSKAENKDRKIKVVIIYCGSCPGFKQQFQVGRKRIEQVYPLAEVEGVKDLTRSGKLDVVYKKQGIRKGQVELDEVDVLIHSVGNNGDKFLHMGAGGGGGDQMIAKLIKQVEKNQ